MVRKEDTVESLRARVTELRRRITDTEAENDQLKQEVSNLNRIVRTDSLTGLFNQKAFKETLKRELSRLLLGSSRVITLVVFDLNKFKKINDTFGHEVGDQALRIVANALRMTVRFGDTTSYYRQHGDEFAMILCECDEKGTPCVIFRFIEELQRQSQNFVVGGQKVELSAAFGAATVRLQTPGVDKRRVAERTSELDGQTIRVFELADDCQLRAKTTPEGQLPLQVVSTTI